MKKTAIIVVGAAVIAIVAGFAIFWVHAQSRDIAQYLPAQPAVAGVTIHASTAKVFGHFAARHFTFSTSTGLKVADVATLFEPQLATAGWERLASATDGNVSTTSWRHREKINGGLYLVVAVLQLDAKGEYLATMTTVPYWPNP